MRSVKMKLFRYICAGIIFILAAYLGYRCIGEISRTYILLFGLVVCCGMIVLLDGGRSTARQEQKKKNYHS